MPRTAEAMRKAILRGHQSEDEREKNGENWVLAVGMGEPWHCPISPKFLFYEIINIPYSSNSFLLGLLFLVAKSTLEMDTYRL